ncbi:MAG: hypothetical protein KAT34_04850 [Candidatus Aminicenantes bacterium]|nr:hypothetical protein [Candidatus Aminicenantes bacterium]
MGVKGFIRAVQAAQRQAEREAKRRQRELERQQKEYAKMQKLERAVYEVECYENKIDLLLSIHKECGNVWDWEEIQKSKAPTKPSKNNQKKVIAKMELENFKPGIFIRLFGRTEIKRNNLIEAINVAKKQDENDYQDSVKLYEQKSKDWEESQSLAEKILSGDSDAYYKAIKEINPFSEINQIGSEIDFNIINTFLIEATLKPNSEKVIPNETKSLLTSGKLSVKKMPKGYFYELYQDYVCGCILRVSRELFALLPVEMVIIHAIGNLLNSKTGNLEEKTILSAAIPRKTLETFNFDMLDPSDSMDNFVHKMNFKKSKSFEAVEKINPSDLK